VSVAGAVRERMRAHGSRSSATAQFASAVT